MADLRESLPRRGAASFHVGCLFPFSKDAAGARVKSDSGILAGEFTDHFDKD